MDSFTILVGLAFILLLLGHVKSDISVVRVLHLSCTYMHFVFVVTQYFLVGAPSAVNLHF